LSKRTSVVAVAVAALLVVAGCSDDKGSLPDYEAKKAVKAAATCVGHEEVPPGADPEAPAVAVKIENDPAARPQSGLEDADVVFEEIVEGGITRFMAIYHCSDAKRVGPVRSARFDDPKIAIPFTNILAFSGANSIVAKQLKRNDMITLVEGMKGSAFYRVPEGSTSVHSVFADTESLRKLAPKTKHPRPGIFPVGEIPEGAEDAKAVKINFEKDNPIEYRWANEGWARYEGGEKFMAKSGDQIAVPNLLIQEVLVDHSPGLVDIEGNPSPDITLKGSGRAVLFRNGVSVEGTWTYTNEGEPPSLETKEGDAFAFADGPVWVELVPSKKGEVKGSFSYK
jgi:Protein of unknown function (DUF3048) N-terminal domain/Protein of unknown function (DUF3048) C-terminal domain